MKVHTLRTGNDFPRNWGYIDASDSLVVSGKLILQGETVSGASIELDSAVASYS